MYLERLRQSTCSIKFHDSVITSGHGTSIGSGIYNKINTVSFYNLTIRNYEYGLSIKFKLPTGSDEQAAPSVSNVSYNNIKISNTDEISIYFNSSYGGKPNPRVIFSNIAFNNVVSVGSKKRHQFLFVKSSQLADPISLTDVSVTQIKDDPTKDQDKNASFTYSGSVIGIGNKQING